MDLPAELPTGASADQLTALLRTTAGSLSGKPLRKSSWQEVAALLVSGSPLRGALWKRLRHATTRDDALRVLRIVRKRSAQKRANTRGSKGRRQKPRGSRSTTRIQAERQREVDERGDPLYDEFWNTLDPWHPDRNWDTPDDWDLLVQATRQAVAFEGRSLDLDAAPQQSRRQRASEAEHDTPIEIRLLAHSESSPATLDDSGFESRVRATIGGRSELRALEEHVGPISQSETATLLCVFAPFWLRRPSQWSGEGRLIDHLLVRTPVPEFLYPEWSARYRRDEKWLRWFVILAQGGSLHRAAQHFGWQVPKKLQQHLHAAPPGVSPIEGVVFGEVFRRGGQERDARRLCDRRFVIDPTEAHHDARWSAFWEETVRWFIEHGDEFDDEAAGLLLDWATHEQTEARQYGTTFSWKRRSVAASLARARAYRAAVSTPYTRLHWEAHGWDATYAVEDAGVTWTFTELTSGRELFEEGQAMGHCVSLYANRCATGHSAILSLQTDGLRRITIEVRPHDRRVVQARGRFNRECDDEERQVIGRWVREILNPSESDSESTA